MEHLKKEQMIFSALFAVEVIKAPMETPAVFVAGSYSGTFRNPIRQKVLESYRMAVAVALQHFLPDGVPKRAGVRPGDKDGWRLHGGFDNLYGKKSRENHLLFFQMLHIGSKNSAREPSSAPVCASVTREPFPRFVGTRLVGTGGRVEAIWSPSPVTKALFSLLVLLRPVLGIFRSGSPTTVLPILSA